jgi:hypothetical protein
MATPLQSPIRLPNDSERLAIVGATGSGKTVAALWHLSHRNYHEMPWVAYNFKYDKNIDSIPFVRPLEVDELPTQAGVYVTHPMPEDDDGAVDAQMKAIWARGNIGVYVDEGYMIPRGNKSFQMLLTQGRSKNIPMITLSQRPVWMNRFVFSESEFYQVFRLQHRKDQESMAQVVPANFEQRIPRYHSWYYDAGNDDLRVVRPVPNIETIHRTFRERLGRLDNYQRRVV